MTNPLAPEAAQAAELLAAATLHVIRQRRVTELAGKCGQPAGSLVEVARSADGQHVVTEHTYHGERQLECTCAAYAPGKPCAGVAAVLAVELVAATGSKGYAWSV